MITRRINVLLLLTGISADSHAILKVLIDIHYRKIREPSPGHVNSVTTTNIWHFRELFRREIAKQHGAEAGRVALASLKEAIKCYAAKLHLNRGSNILKPNRKVNNGYALTFEQVRNFDGRVAEAAKWSDTLGLSDPEKPWMKGLPRTNFVSDMGDAFSYKTDSHFAFLEREVIEPVISPQGQRHLWLWLTKRPKYMEAFARRIGGMPVNVCAMSTVTSTKTLGRVDELRKVDAHCRGLSIEPLWDRIPPEALDLTGIDWVIVGGESGSRESCRPFHVEWAEELREHCRKHGVAFVLKQLGRNVFVKGKPLVLKEPHGGDWNEWPKEHRVREFPRYFHDYRKHELEALLASR
ncbi:MAG: DUF5131 family protein [Luteolibacter sp.]